MNMKAKLAITAILLAQLPLAGCAIFDEKDEGPSPAELAAIEQEYRSREKTLAKAFSQSNQTKVNKNAIATNAMVGQVNGNPIYANTVFDGIDEQLTSLGKNLSRAEFFREIKGTTKQPGIVQQRLGSIIIDALILGEAERDLNDMERMQVQMFIKKVREDLIREFGQGSAALADKTIFEKFGVTLAEELENRRRGAIIDNYLRQKITPLINVTYNDVERYYRDHYEDYNPPAKCDLRLIKTSKQSDAQEVQAALTNNANFAEVASSKLNTFLTSAGGFYGDLNPEKPFADHLAPINEAISHMKQGDRTNSPIKVGPDYWFVYVEKLQKAQSVPLRDVQLVIKSNLEKQQYGMLRQKYMHRILMTGSYDDQNKMASLLLEIAMNRYAAPE